MNIEKMYDPKEVAKILGFTERTVEEYIRQGKIKSVKVLGSNRVKESDLKALIKEREVK